MRISAVAPRAVLVTLLVASAVALVGCAKSNDATAAAPAVESALPSANVAPPEAPPPPPTAEASAWTPSALDELLAPIALYPDAVLAQVLAAATNSQEVLDAGNWLLDNQTLKPDELTKAAADAGFSPSMQALVHFPNVVDMMCRELDWTRQVGDAFAADQAAVLASVQRLRAQAEQVGNLKSSPEMNVEKTAEANKQVIVIQPADPKVIYVPQYNPTQVYTAPPPATTSSGISTETAVIGGLLAFGAGILVANAFDNNNHNDHYYPYPNWGYGGVYYGPRPYYPHKTFVYAPSYPGYRPTPYYRPPAAYPYRNNNYNNYGKTNVNVNVTNNNYFNRFDKNQNRLPTYQPRPPIASPASVDRSSYRGQTTTYKGANQPRPTNATSATRERVGQAPPGTYQGSRAGQPAPSGAYQGQGAGARDRQANAAQRPATSAQRPTAGGDRGYPKTSGKRSDVTATTQKRGGSLGDAGRNQSSMDRAASERGRASMQTAPRPSARQQPAASKRGGSGAQQRAKSSNNQNRARQQ